MTCSPPTPCPRRVVVFTPEQLNEQDFDHDDSLIIIPRRLYPGSLTRRGAIVRNRDIARHRCHRGDCLLCLPDR